MDRNQHPAAKRRFRNLQSTFESCQDTAFRGALWGSLDTDQTVFSGLVNNLVRSCTEPVVREQGYGVPGGYACVTPLKLHGGGG